MSAAAPLSKLSFQRADGSPRRVLYAEDQITSRVVTKAMLERMGFDVDAVEDGELALQRARNDNYDVILLDIEMPVMDGVTAARSIRAELAHCNDTPILALSAFLADSTEHTKWRDTFDSALPKPANTNELLLAMQSAVKVKDSRAAKIPAKPSKEDLVGALKQALPPAVWKKICATAADEMYHLINVLGAARDAEDHGFSAQAAKKLHQLAASFGAAQVAEMSSGSDVQVLRQAVSNWTMV
jgi:CheY-like chemotaxis protein